MLRITVELVPFGDESQSRKIGEMVLANAGPNPDGTYAYEAWVGPDSHTKTPAQYGVVHSFDRKRSMWDLIRLMLGAIDQGNQEPTTLLSDRLKKRLG